MKPPRTDDFAERRQTAVAAKKALLERARGHKGAPAEPGTKAPAENANPKTKS